MLHCYGGYHLWEFGYIMTNGCFDIESWVKIAANFTNNQISKLPLAIMQPNFTHDKQSNEVS